MERRAGRKGDRRGAVGRLLAHIVKYLKSLSCHYYYTYSESIKYSTGKSCETEEQEGDPQGQAYQSNNKTKVCVNDRKSVPRQ